MKKFKLLLLGILLSFGAFAQDKKTSEEATGGTLKSADLFRYSEESSGSYASKKHTMGTLKTYVQTGVVNIYNEVPTLDGGRTVVTFANDYTSGSVRLFVEGVRLTPTSDYTETSSDQVTLTIPLPAGEIIVSDYIPQ